MTDEGSGPPGDGGGKDRLLTEAASGEVQIPIRELLRLWGAKRRGYLISWRIQSDLMRAGLETDPPFTEGWIDGIVRIVPVGRLEQERTTEASQDLIEAIDRSLPDVSLRIGSLPAAHQEVRSVSPDANLDLAQAIMMRWEFSQLAVMNGPRTFRGAVSWESIAQARVRDPGAELKDAIRDAPVMPLEADLLAAVPTIVEAGFVFVRGQDNSLAGIVTTADLSFQFADLATPFFVLAEIERRLRSLVDRHFKPDELQSVADPSSGTRQIKSAADLTLGEYVRLLEDPKRWPRLGWALDRKQFVAALNDVRDTRNEVMHFSPDPLEADQINYIRNFLSWLRKLDPQP